MRFLWFCGQRLLEIERKSPYAISTAIPSGLPDELQQVAVAARKNVEQGKYRTAEKQYQTVLAEDPKNLDALSNLGVVYFRTGKIRSAESTLKKALAIAPNDDSVLTTLGIVHYRQSKFDPKLINKINLFQFKHYNLS